MSWNAATILALVAILLAVLGLIKPTWPMAHVAVLLIGIAVLLIAQGKA